MFAFLILLQVATDPTAAPVVVQQAISWTTVMLGLVSGLPATIAAIGGILALLQSRHNAVVAAQTDKKVDEVSAKATEIHVLTNGSLTKVTEELRAANQRIETFATAQVENNKNVERLQSMLEKLAQNVVPAPTGAGNTGSALGEVPLPLPVTDAAANESLETIIDIQQQQGKIQGEQGSAIKEQGKVLGNKLPKEKK